MSFPRYNEYQDSGFNWLGQVPTHWSLRRLGYYFGERREKVSDRDYQPLSVTKDGIVPQLETAAKTDDGDNRKKVRKGDFVINSRSDRKGSAGLSGLDGSVSLISTVLKPNESVHGPFVHHLLRCIPFQEEFYRFGKGIVADLWSTNYSSMSGITLAMPPLSEQHEIASFLDRETAKIDALIAEQQRLIELLQEKRQAVISHAVTKGLNPNAPMKDSGVEWLGEVPERWEVKRMKHLCKSIEQGWSPQCENEPSAGEAPGVLKVGCVNGGVFRPTENKKLPSDLTPIPQYSVKKGDLLVSRANTKELVGSAAVVDEHFPWLYICDKLYRITVKADCSTADYLCLYLASSEVRGEIELGASGASPSMQNISQSVLLDLPVPLPQPEEQESIRSFITIQCDQIDELTAKAMEAIRLFQERRSALISAAVTGQIDIRGLATGEEP